MLPGRRFSRWLVFVVVAIMILSLVLSTGFLNALS